MGKFTKKPKVQKTKSTSNAGVKKGKKGQKGQKKKGRAAAKRHAAAVREARNVESMVSTAAAEASMDVAMSGSAQPASARGSFGEEATKVVSALSKARTESKLMDALKKALNANPSPEALGAALTHCAGRGLAAAVKMLLERGAPTTIEDVSQAPGRTTALQLSASRGHVNVVRFLVEAGADRTGALEASQDLAKLGAIFAEEKRAIQAVLR
mmetsp:Transcript_89511/g.258168  ORF Transcript_89511/g.258168 Transcript_89511/m.258168 type:complete len:212 (-) Transcript_89511:19-654(-)